MAFNKVSRRGVLQTIGAVGATLTLSGFASASDGRARYIAGTNGNATEAIESAGFSVLAELADGDVVLVKGPEGATDALNNVNNVSTAVRDFAVELEGPVTPTDVGVDSNHGHADADEVYEEYQWDKQVQDVQEAHDLATGAGRTVAVLDTGVDDDHPDLDVNVEDSTTIEEGQPNEHTGDDGFHGTHVAGIIAGTEDVAMLGTAPDATIISVRILGPGTGTWGDILGGMEYAAEIGADAANMSIGTIPIPPEANSAGYRRLLESVANTVTRDGTLLVGSSGNDDANLQQGGFFTLPNSLAGVFSIGATTPNDKKTYYSNYGTNEIGVGAPGGGYEAPEKTFTEDPEVVEWPWPLNAVFSTVPDVGLVPDPYQDTIIAGEAYAWLMGTSMAAPQVSGLAALVREVAPDANARQVENLIKQGAEDTNGKSDPELGAGRTNALNTVERAARTNSGRQSRSGQSSARSYGHGW